MTLDEIADLRRGRYNATVVLLRKVHSDLMILRVRLEVVGERVDPLREERDLHLGRAGVGFVRAILGSDLLLVETHSSRDP